MRQFEEYVYRLLSMSSFMFLRAYQQKIVINISHLFAEGILSLHAILKTLRVSGTECTCLYLPHYFFPCLSLNVTFTDAACSTLIHIVIELTCPSSAAMVETGE
ncbi:hypothetical protein KP509_02G111100 [Ceratopteris richardii]|uniref:Uncharacterized protein n=1 Tax=Ceratopteris richardii TaxID=49495 RepID=A0A8T2VL43_CERRI|nr:hypothetical protein KP509_02G111100 [Ceratopteris richardii]